MMTTVTCIIIIIRMILKMMSMSCMDCVMKDRMSWTHHHDYRIDPPMNDRVGCSVWNYRLSNNHQKGVKAAAPTQFTTTTRTEGKVQKGHQHQHNSQDRMKTRNGPPRLKILVRVGIKQGHLRLYGTCSIRWRYESRLIGVQVLRECNRRILPTEEAFESVLLCFFALEKIPYYICVCVPTYV